MSIETLKQLVAALEYHTAQTRPITQTQEAISAGKAAIEQTENQDQIRAITQEAHQKINDLEDEIRRNVYGTPPAAMDLALEALEYIENNYMSLPKSGSEAITAIKQARSAPVQEPVAYVVTTEVHGQMCSFIHRIDLTKLLPDGAKLYTTPPAAKPATEESSAVVEPASWMEMVTANLVREGVNKHKARELAEHFYSLAQRPFVGLTPREIYNLWEDSGVPFVDWDSFASITRAIESKLREKNGGAA